MLTLQCTRATPARPLTALPSSNWEWNCLCICYSFAVSQWVQKALQGACFSAPTNSRLLLLADTACSCTECQRVIICTWATKEEAWECRWKSKDPETRASGQVEKAPARVDEQANTQHFLSLSDSEWAGNESESFSLAPFSWEVDGTPYARCSRKKRFISHPQMALVIGGLL